MSGEVLVAVLPSRNTKVEVPAGFGATPVGFASTASSCNELIKRVEQLCAANGVTLTKLRLAVLRQLWATRGSAIGVYDLTANIIHSDGGQIAPNSVYRVLAKLQALGVVRRIESRQAYKLMQGGAADGDIFLLCDPCKSIAAIYDSGIETVLADRARAEGFGLQSRIIEISGHCGPCRRAAPLDG